MTTENQTRARLCCERAGIAPEHVAGLGAMLDEAEARGRGPATLTGDETALALIQGAVRDQLRDLKAHGNVRVFPPLVLGHVSAGVAAAVAWAIDGYRARPAGRATP